jgi:hypothetical protein
MQGTAGVQRPSLVQKQQPRAGASVSGVAQSCPHDVAMLDVHFIPERTQARSGLQTD